MVKNISVRSAAFFFMLFWGFHSASAAEIRAMNPDIGVNFLTKFERNSFQQNQGFSVQEAELQLKADVDPYFTANVMFSVAPSAPGAKEYTIDPEEVFVETVFIPSLTLRAGKFHEAFGKHNLLHTHAFPFIDAPLIHSVVLGPDGLNGSGISGSYLIPTPWFSEFVAQEFGNGQTVGHARSLVDLSDDTTIELGVSGLSQWAWGVDLTLKHRPTDFSYGRSFNLGFEWIKGLNQTGSISPTQGWVSYLQYEFLHHFYGQYRYDDVITTRTTRHGVLLGFAPSEFSAFRVQYDQTLFSTLTEHRLLAQMSISIGAHPAHEY